MKPRAFKPTLAPLLELLRFPTVSSLPGSRAAMQDCAHWLRARLARCGASDARLVPSEPYPLVIGHVPGPVGAKRVLIYGHYDVQPVEPIAEWRSPPFEPQVRGGYVYARGASDDKGQLFAHLCAVQRLRAAGKLPVHVTFLIDGSEELGSPGLARVFEQLAPELQSDVAVVSDMPVLGLDRPSLSHALRGDLYLDVELHGRGADLHSGSFGGAVAQPLEALSQALGALHTNDGRVAVDGFYDQVLEVSGREREYMRRFGPDRRELQRATGNAVLTGEPGFSSYERATIRPALHVAGIRGGYTGAGIKGVIPASAHAKLDVRLVPRQSPERIHRRVFEFLARRLPAGMQLTTRERMRIPAVVLDRRHPMLQAAARAYGRGFGKRPVFVRRGGSIRVVSLLQERLGVPTVLMGFGLPDDGAHASNERFSLAMLARGMRTSAAFLDEVARL